MNSSITSAPIALEEAQKRIIALREPLDSQMVPVTDSHGLYLAQPLTALRTQPPADLSAMDGYAIKGGGPWQLIGESRAGASFGGFLSDNEAVRISTGAITPKGTDSVLIQENARIDRNNLSSQSDLPQFGTHIRRAGFDFTSGQQLLESGTQIGPAHIALALSAGHAELPVYGRPSLALIESGDELAADPTDCSSEQIPASNNAMLAAMASGLTDKITRIGPVADDLDALDAAFNNVSDANVIVTSGGASVGDHDLIRPALENWGATIEFWRVAIKPGKPLLIARKDTQIILGLPGNPVSSFATGFLFLLPLLRHLSGASQAIPRQLVARTNIDLPSGGPRREFMRAYWDGESLNPIDQQDSSALRALSSANALIIRDEQCKEAKRGTNVPFYLLQNGGIA